MVKTLKDRYESLVDKEKALLEQADKIRQRRVRLAGPAKNKLSAAFDKALTKFVSHHVEEVIHSKISIVDLERAFLVALSTIICPDYIEDDESKNETNLDQKLENIEK